MFNRYNYIILGLQHSHGRIFNSIFCKDIKIEKNMVCFFDLIIDIWVPLDGAITILDENELQDCRASGQISPEEEIWIERQKEIILTDSSNIIKDVIQAESSLCEPDAAHRCLCHRVLRRCSGQRLC